MPEKLSQVDSIIKFMDSDLDNYVTVKEFAAFYRKYDSAVTDEKLSEEFSYSDYNYDGKWTRPELCQGFIYAKAAH